jgi:secondary thiamine-phosphate synthase enzyme
MVYTEKIEVRTRGNDDIVDITDNLVKAVEHSKIRHGIATVFVAGSTAAVTTMEYEPGLCKDLPTAMERLAPRDAPYAHEARWGDDNGHSHVRASLVGPSLTVPVVNGELALGRWQQVVLIDFDTHPRDRTVLVQMIGER